MCVKALTEISTFPRYRMPADIAKEALSNAQATAEAYERELKAKVFEEATKMLDDRHLESLQMCILPATMLRERAAKLRAQIAQKKGSE